MNSVPVRLLEKWQEHSWGSNNIGLHDWFRPMYYANVDTNNFEEERGRDIVATACRAAKIAFINSIFANRMVTEYGLSNIIPVRRFNSVYGKTKFIDDPLGVGFSTAAPTVTFILMQLAYAEGYNTLLMVGLDHTYGIKQPHFYDDNRGSPYLHKSDSVNTAWREKCDKGFGLARQFLEERGGRIINLTDAETTTRIFERDKAENWL